MVSMVFILSMVSRVTKWLNMFNLVCKINMMSIVSMESMCAW
jgi:hypothetical protein